MRTWLAVVIALAGLIAGDGRVQALADGRAFLTSTFALTRDDLARLDSGQPVLRTLRATDAREVGTLGIVRMRTTPEAYIERLRDIVAFKRTENILEIGRFSNPPAVADLAPFTVEERDLRELRACRVGACDVRLSADAIERMQRDVDWNAREAPRLAADVLKQVLVDYVAQYRRPGRSGMMIYADDSTPVDMAAEFAALVEADGETWRHVPSLRQHLLTFAAHGGGITDFVYWSKERVHRRPVISMTHVAIAAAGEDSPIDYAVASKQIYAMHYFDASVGLTLLLRDRNASVPATYVVYLNRSRIDLFDGLLGGVARKVAAGRARTLVGEQLLRLQRTMTAPPAVTSSD